MVENVYYSNYTLSSNTTYFILLWHRGILKPYFIDTQQFRNNNLVAHDSCGQLNNYFQIKSHIIEVVRNLNKTNSDSFTTLISESYWSHLSYIFNYTNCDRKVNDCLVLMSLFHPRERGSREWLPHQPSGRGWVTDDNSAVRRGALVLFTGRVYLGLFSRRISSQLPSNR